jgi:cellulase (glycosyl hydrolase family 5)
MPPRFRVFLSLATLPALATLGVLGACHTSASAPSTAPYDAGPPYAPQFHPLDSDGHVMRDATGRTVILRGYNVKVNGLFDVTPDNGDPVREIVPPLDDSDYTLMQQSGVNVLRLPVNWSAFEPQQGTFQASYLAAIDTFLDSVRPYGFYVLLDFHEDGWSKDICEDGAPAWATVVSPGDWEGGVANEDCHAANAAISAHTNFLQYDSDNLQEDFATMYQQFAAHFVNEELVFGYEIFNEPISTDAYVDAFSIKLATAIRQVDPGHLILWEPSALRNLFNSSYESPTPFPVAGGVYAVHIYTTPIVFPNSIASARSEADSWGEPLFVTEHGASPIDGGGEAGLGWVDAVLDGFDQNLASSMDWIWNPGVITRDPDGGGIVPLYGGQILTHLTRPYAMAVGGDVTTTTWDGSALTIVFTPHPGVPFTHDVYWNVGTPTVTCDGVAVADVKEDSKRLVFTVSCGGAGTHTLVFSGGS